jgi:NADPH-dependent 2,4-dienoyl-CoA reductase/sulfur reductase-like enzyme
MGLYVGKKSTGFTKNTVELEDGTSIPADMVILYIGVAPETRFLQGSGVELGRRGEILINEQMETSVKDIYALGDAATVKNIINGNTVVIPLAGPANKQGRLVADIICGKDVSYKGSQGTSIMKLFEMTVACTGEKEESLIAAGVPYHKTYTCNDKHGNKNHIKIHRSPSLRQHILYESCKSQEAQRNQRCRHKCNGQTL